MKKETDLFSLWDIAFEESGQEPNGQDLEEYLRKEEKIQTLVRKKKKRPFQVSSVMETICNSRFAKAQQAGEESMMMYLISALSGLIKGRLEEGREAFLELFSAFADMVDVSDLNDPEDRKLLNGVKKMSDRLPLQSVSSADPSDVGISVTLPVSNRGEGEIDETHLLVDPRGNVRSCHNGAGSKIRGEKGAFRYCCNPDVFSVIVLLSYMRSRVQEDIAEYGEESILYRKLMRLQHAVIAKNVEENGNLYIYSPSCRPFVIDYLRGQRLSFLRSEKASSGTHVLQEQDFIPAFLVAASLSREDFVFSMVSTMFFVKGKVRSKTFLSLGGLGWGYEHSRIIEDVLAELVGDYRERKKDDEYEKSLERDYASVWETKKNIPQKVLKAMKNSSFNDSFGYVEIDETCDLDSIGQLEKEWKAVTGLLGIDGYKDTALRFRKLGNHKAAGLYFPFLNCLCVDVRHPSSMMHETFHMLDFHEGKLSSQYSFYGIRRRYEECLRRSVSMLPDKDPVRVKMEGKSKYNISYYLTPTEIFARCGEMYLIRSLGVDNSLVKPEGGIAYPEDTKLMELVKDYFDRFFQERRDVA